MPKNLATAVVREEDFTIGLPLLQLPPETDAAWHNMWQEFKAGG